jgi:hypothetical protein
LKYHKNNSIRGGKCQQLKQPKEKNEKTTRKGGFLLVQIAFI